MVAAIHSGSPGWEKEEEGQKKRQWVTAPRNHRNCLTTFSAHGKGQKKQCTESVTAQQPGTTSTLERRKKKKIMEPTVAGNHEALLVGVTEP